MPGFEEPFGDGQTGSTSSVEHRCAVREPREQLIEHGDVSAILRSCIEV